MIPDRTTPNRLILAAFFAFGATAPAAAFNGPKVIVRGAEYSSGPTPVVVDAPAGVEPGDYLLVGEGNGEVLPANVFEAEGGRRLAILLDRVEVRLDRTYHLTPDTPGDRLEAQIVPIRVVPGAGGSVDVLAGGEEFTRLVVGERKPYFFPVVGPLGNPVTRAYPMLDVAGEDRDHPHQRSFWLAHGDVNGVDFWASDPLNPAIRRPGTIRPIGAPETTEGLAAGLLRSRNAWLDPDGKSLCEDERTLLFWAAKGYRFIDAEILLKAGDEPVTFGDTKEGTFAVRVASALDANRPRGGKIVNAEGVEDQEAWGKPSAWVDYSGTLAGTRQGVAILEHPDSFRHPTTWHVRDYGLFAANPFGYHDFGVESEGAHTIEPGGSIRLCYRVVLHAGDVEDARIGEVYRGYASPPAIEFPED